MKTEVYCAADGLVWQGKLDFIPRAGDKLGVNNKTRYGHYVVLSVEWRVDEKRVILLVAEQ